MNAVFFGLVAVAFLFVVVRALSWNPDCQPLLPVCFDVDTAVVQAVGDAAMSSAKGSVELAIGLIGYITLFLGLMKIVEEAGGLAFMARLIRPLMVRLFPDVPPDHPAMGAMIMNIAANALGLGNAATPFGLKAMKELNTLNQEEGTATNAMVLFLAINTSGLALLPTGIIGLRAHLESADPAAIFPTTLMATAISTVCGVLAAKWLSKLPIFALAPSTVKAPRASDEGRLWPLLIFLTALVALVVSVYFFGEAVSVWIIPTLIAGILFLGFIRRVKVYEVFITGAKEGFQLAVMIIPYLVAILVAVGMLRASGALGAIVSILAPLTERFGLPAEVLPLAMLRPLSGSGAFGITADLLEQYGPDSLIGMMASTLNGSTETTFYVLAVYFGSIGITRIRHAVFAGLAADLAGVVGAVLAVQLLLN